MSKYNREDLTGKQFGLWSVLNRQGTTRNGVMYSCKCSCGTERVLSAAQLHWGKSKSCGCNRRKPRFEMSGERVGHLTVVGLATGCPPTWECKCDCGTTTHRTTGQLTEAQRSKRVSNCGCGVKGNYNTKEYKLWEKAKARAKRVGVPFDLAVKDIVIPKVCPLLGIRIEPDNRGTWKSSSPTIDRKAPGLGYVRGNVWVISHRANLLKNDATTEELELLTRKLREYEIK